MVTRQVVLTVLWSLYSSSSRYCHAFSLRPRGAQTSTALHANLFQNMFGAAFANDENLSKENGFDGSIDEGGDESESSGQQQQQQRLTATQQAWRRSMLGGGGVTTLDGTSVALDLFLTGVPNKDPSNDLFAVKTNISSRDRAVGQELPATPSVTNMRLAFSSRSNSSSSTEEEDAARTCTVVDDASGFGDMDSPGGTWRLSDDGRQVRFRIPVRGYTRTVQTKGTIQKVYWSTQDQRSIQTQTVYQIPEGWLYGEAEIKVSGTGIAWSEGVLKVEQSVGLLGVASKMVPCGKFVATSKSSAVVAPVEEKTMT